MAERKKKFPNRHVFSDDELEAPPVSIHIKIYTLPEQSMTRNRLT